MFFQRIKALGLWQKKVIRIVAVLFCLLFFCCIFMIIKPNACHYFPGERFFESGAAEAGTVYDEIPLPAGVYSVELEYACDTDYAALCTVQDGTVFTGGLLTNGEHLYQGRSKTEYLMWLFEDTEKLQVIVVYGGAGELQTGALTIRETNLLWTMLLVIFTGVFLLALSGLVFYYYQKQYPVSEQGRNVFFFVTLIGLIASLPYFHRGVYGGADLTYHLHRIEGVRDGLLSGQFPVRLEPEWLFGHGYADAIFYCNALLYFPALLRLAGFTVSAAYNCYAIVLNLATAWIAWYCFRKIYRNNVIGLVCSGLYTLSVFRVSRFFVTGTVGEGGAYVFMPLVIYGLYRILTEDTEEKSYRTAWMPVAIGYAGLIQTHVLSCEIAAFLTLLVCLICIRRVLQRSVFLQMAKGALGALGLSLWYLVPFLDYYLTQDVHIRHVSGRTIQERGLTLSNLVFHFWEVDHLDGADGMGISLVLLLGLLCFWVLCLGGNCRLAERRNRKLALLSAFFGTLLLVMSLRCFPWDAIQGMSPRMAALVSSLQIPYRVHGWATACLVTVFGFVLSIFAQKGRGFYIAGCLAAVFGVLLSGVLLTERTMLNTKDIKLYNAEGMGVGYIAGAEYLIEGTDYRKLTYTGPKAGDAVIIDAYEKQSLRVAMDCHNDSAEESYVELPLLFYKGYRAAADSREPLAVEAGENHVARVILPAGFSGEVRVWFQSPFYWRVSELASFVVLFLFCLSGCRYRKRGGQ